MVKSTPANSLHIKEDHKEKRADNYHLKGQELADIQRKKTSESNIACNEFLQECGAPEINSDNGAAIEQRNICKGRNKKQSEKVDTQEDKCAWFAKSRLVRQEKEKDFFKVLVDAIPREDVPIEAPSQQQDKPSSSSSIGPSLPLKFRFEDEEPETPEKSDYEIMVAGLFAEIERDRAYVSMETFELRQVRTITSFSLCSKYQ